MLVATRVPSTVLSGSQSGSKPAEGKLGAKDSKAPSLHEQGKASDLKVAVASFVEVVPDDGWQIKTPSKNEEKPISQQPVHTSRKYSIADLFALHDRMKAVVNGEKSDAMSKITASAVDDVPLVSFRSRPSGKGAISFHVDIDVPANCIVNVNNVDNRVEWPQLNTFCVKTVGVKPLSIRMQRRTNPGSAHILFSTPEEAEDFLSRVPSGVRFKGRKPRFVRNDATAGAKCKGDANGSGNAAGDGAEIEIATAIVCDHPDLAQDDDCCKK